MGGEAYFALAMAISVRALPAQLRHSLSQSATSSL
jgi:hypothetical protein